MIQNIKVDVVYYRTPTDFEMEFNMCGCCKMRLLTGKSSERRDFVNSLARAVQRSRVIIACGPLFSENGLISIIASAISRPLEKINGAQYGISGSETVEIIEGAVPLVTSDGVFGGCIIESGPQAIIVLTESKSLRKILMRDLIHPYIEELSISSLQREAAQDIAADREDESGSKVSEAGELDIAQPEPEDEPESEPEPPADRDMPEEAKTEMTEEHNVTVEMDSNSDEKNGNEFLDEGSAEKRVEENKTDGNSRFNVPIIVLSVMLVLLLILIAYILIYIPLSSGQNISEYIRSLFETISSVKGV